MYMMGETCQIVARQPQKQVTQNILVIYPSPNLTSLLNPVGDGLYSLALPLKVLAVYMISFMNLDKM